MRVGGRQKGSKQIPYTHIVVNKNAPKSRYLFSIHSSEEKANAAVKKYSPLVGHPLSVVKQSGKSANTDMMENQGESKMKETTTTAAIPNPADTAMGPIDKKRKKTQTIMMRRFKEYVKTYVKEASVKHTHAILEPDGKILGFASNEKDAIHMSKHNLQKIKGKVVKLKTPMSGARSFKQIGQQLKNEAINHDDAHHDAQTHSDGSMSVKKIPSMIKKSGDKHLHLHMKSYHKEKDGQAFAKKHGYKVKNYVKTLSGTRMDIHKESVDEARAKVFRMYPK